MVIADAIWRDPASGKCTILGCFALIAASEFPAVHPQLAVYVALTDGRGKVPIKIRMVDVDDETEPVFEVETEVQFSDPTVVIEMDVHFNDVTLPHAGEFRIQLFASDDLLSERRIEVEQLSPE
jgi:hypothetical protein